MTGKYTDEYGVQRVPLPFHPTELLNALNELMDAGIDPFASPQQEISQALLKLAEGLESKWGKVRPTTKIAAAMCAGLRIGWWMSAKRHGETL